MRSGDGVTCTSDPSNEAQATGTGACTLAPVFDGLQSVFSPALNNCTLELAWTPALSECGGSTSFKSVTRP